MNVNKFEWKVKNRHWVIFKEPEFYIKIFFLNNWFVPKSEESGPE